MSRQAGRQAGSVTPTTPVFLKAAKSATGKPLKKTTKGGFLAWRARRRVHSLPPGRRSPVFCVRRLSPEGGRSAAELPTTRRRYCGQRKATRVRRMRPSCSPLGSRPTDHRPLSHSLPSHVANQTLFVTTKGDDKSTLCGCGDTGAHDIVRRGPLHQPRPFVAQVCRWQGTTSDYGQLPCQVSRRFTMIASA